MTKKKHKRIGHKLLTSSPASLTTKKRYDPHQIILHLVRHLYRNTRSNDYTRKCRSHNRPMTPTPNPFFTTGENGIAYLSENFKRWFDLAGVEPKKAKLTSTVLPRSMNSKEIL